MWHKISMTQAFSLGDCRVVHMSWWLLRLTV